MRTMMRDAVYPALGAIVLTLVLMGTAAAELNCQASEEKGVPFHGTLQGVETDTPDFPNLFVDGSGTGTATHLGAFLASWLVTVDISVDPSPSTGKAEFVAANGDRLFTEIVGEGTGGAVAHIVECNTITGGTGRFAGATGAFTMRRIVELATGATSGSFVGTLVKHKAK